VNRISPVGKIHTCFLPST